MNASIPQNAGLLSYRLLGWFLGLCLALSALCYWPILRGGELGVWGLALMWCPGVAALISRWVVQHNLHGMGWHLPGRMTLLAWALPVIAALLVYSTVWLAGWGGLDLAAVRGDGPLAVRVAMIVVVGLLLNLVFATGEEIGWRGLLLPQLARRMTPAKAALASGIVWALFHYPAILLADYHGGAPTVYALTAFTITVFAVSFLLAWMRLRSGSFWPAAMFHASHNLYVQDVFDHVTVDGPLTPYLTTEFGAGLCLMYALAAAWLWRKYPPGASA